MQEVCDVLQLLLLLLLRNLPHPKRLVKITLRGGSPKQGSVIRTTSGMSHSPEKTSHASFAEALA